MVAHVPLASSLGLLLSSAIAVQALGALSGNVGQWLHASEAQLQARAAPPPIPALVTADAPHRAVRAPDGMFYLSGSANGKPMRFLIDTGSSMTIMSRSDAARLGLDTRKSEGSHSARTLAGEVRIARVRVDELRIAGKRFAAVTVGVASNDLGVSLIGQDMLSRFDSVVIEKDSANLR